jgi:DNA-binding XRE family transcriptional regulator
MQTEFKEARENAGHTQIEASQEIGCSLSLVSKLETQGQEPKNKLALRAMLKYITRPC